MGMISSMGFGEGTGVRRHGQPMLTEGSGGMLLDFLYESMISIGLLIYFWIWIGMRDRTTFEDAMFREGNLSKTALNPRSSEKLQYEGRGLIRIQFCWMFRRFNRRSSSYLHEHARQLRG